MEREFIVRCGRCHMPIASGDGFVRSRFPGMKATYFFIAGFTAEIVGNSRRASESLSRGWAFKTVSVMHQAIKSRLFAAVEGPTTSLPRSTNRGRRGVE
jgi:hypothetical protein